MAYTATYDSDDVDDIAIDAVGTFGAQIVLFMGLVALVVIWRYAKKKMRG